MDELKNILERESSIFNDQIIGDDSDLQTAKILALSAMKRVHNRAISLCTEFLATKGDSNFRLLNKFKI